MNAIVIVSPVVVDCHIVPKAAGLIYHSSHSNSLVTSNKFHEMHAPLGGVGTTPVTLILAIPSRQIHPSITPHQLVAVCCVIC